jgi:hypothetical protein
MARALGDAEEMYLENVTQSDRTRLAHVFTISKDHCGRIDDDFLVPELPLTWQNISAPTGVRPKPMSWVIRKLDEEGLAHYLRSNRVCPRLRQAHRRNRIRLGHLNAFPVSRVGQAPGVRRRRGGPFFQNM